MVPLRLTSGSTSPIFSDDDVSLSVTILDEELDLDNCAEACSYILSRAARADKPPVQTL